MSGEATGRREAEVVVVDVDCSLAAKHEAIGHAVVHHAQLHLAVRAQRDADFVVVLVDGGELQRHHGQEAVLHTAWLAHRHIALGKRLFAEVQRDVAERVDNLSVLRHGVAQLSLRGVKLHADGSIGRRDDFSCKQLQGGNEADKEYCKFLLGGVHNKKVFVNGICVDTRTRVNNDDKIVIDLNYNEDNSNIYLKLVGYFPRYYQIKNILNQKIINVIKKKIKEKIMKFYNNNNTIINQNLKEIKNNVNKKLNFEDFRDFILTKPIKYFLIDEKNKIINYLFPLIEIAINELLKTFYIKSFEKKIIGSELGWYFKHCCINKIINENFFMNYYIDNSIEIKTIFNSEKLNEYFNLKENTLFYFKYNNVKRYDCAIFFGEKNYLLLIKISIHKSKKQLEKYNSNNFKIDIEKIKRFLNENNINPKKYFLFFILDKDNYTTNEKYMKEFLSYDFKYCFYDKKEDIFKYNNFNPFTQINIDYELNNIKQNNIISFKKHSYFKLIDENTNDNNLFDFKLYYAEIGMNLIDFLDEICSEFILDDIFDNSKNYEKYLLIKYVKTFQSLINFKPNQIFQIERMVIMLNNDKLYIGKLNNDNFKYNWTIYGKTIFLSEKNINIKFEEGYFIFDKISK